VLNLIKSNSIASLEKQVADKLAKLGQLRAQYGEVRQRADELGDLVSSALVDEASNLQSLEGQLFAAESRLRSTQAAIAKVEGEVADLEQKLTAERDRVAREASAKQCRDLADSLKKAKPAAAEATRKIAEIVGSLPATGHYPTHVLQGIEHWVPGAFGFFQGDFLDLAIQSLRTHSDLIEKGERSADLGKSFDEQAATYGKKPWAKAS
jgi:DNA repair exonuclease SbcCD ATPase subunit